MSTDSTTESGCDDLPSYAPENGFRIDPAGTNGVFATVEALGWDVAGPHAGLSTTSSVATEMFASAAEAEGEVAEALRVVWNRILARNLARAEGTTNIMLSAGREALGHFEEAQCLMAANAMNSVEDLNINVPDGQ